MRMRTLTDENRTSNMQDFNADEYVDKEKENNVPPEYKDSPPSEKDSNEKVSPPENGGDDEKSSPQEKGDDEKSFPPESNEEDAVLDSNRDSNNGVLQETSGTGEDNHNSTTVELACQETDL